MTKRPLALLVAFASCGSPSPGSDLGVGDLAGAGDGGGCLASTPATSLYEDMCAAGRCYYDHPPTDGF